MPSPTNLDLDAIVDRVPIDRVVARVDVDGIVASVDLDPIVARVDVDAIAAKIDLDAIVARLDIVGIAREVIDEIDLPEIIRESSGSMASETVVGVRMRGIEADERISRIVDRVILRRHGRDASVASGGRTPMATTEHPSAYRCRPGRIRVDGPASSPGPLLQSSTAWSSPRSWPGFTSRVAGVTFVLNPTNFHWPHHLWLSTLFVWFAIAVPYLTLTWCTTGRSYGDALFGVRVVNAKGHSADFVGAAIRAVLLRDLPDRSVLGHHQREEPIGTGHRAADLGDLRLDATAGDCSAASGLARRRCQEVDPHAGHRDPRRLRRPSGPVGPAACAGCT